MNNDYCIPTGPQVPCIDDGILHNAVGKRDVLFLVSNVPTTDNPDIVPRRSRGPLTEEERRKLEKQGIHEEYCHSDLSIMTAREGLDKHNALVGVMSAGKTTCEGFKSQVTGLMNTTDKEGGNDCEYYLHLLIIISLYSCSPLHWF